MDRLQGLRSWFASPLLPGDEEKNRQAYLVNLIIKMGFLFTVSSLVILPWLSTPVNSMRFLIALIVVIISLLIAQFFLKKGKVSAVGHFLTAIIWLTFAILALLGTEGLTGTPFIGAIALCPIIAGFAGGTRASVVVTVLNWLMGGVLLVLELAGFLASGTGYEPHVQYLGSMIMFSSFPVFMFVWRRTFSEAVEQTRVAELASRQTAVYRSQNEQLEDAVQTGTIDLEYSLVREQQLAQQLSQALESEIQVSELQSRIITVVSHEFRTPLSVISSSAQLLQEYYERLPEARREAAHQRIEEAIFYLNDLLKDVILVEQAQRQRIRPSYQTFAFAELGQHLNDKLMQRLTQPQRVHLQYPAGNTPIQTDLSLLEQILGNLVSNALKYSEKSSPVYIHIQLTAQQMIIEVRDEGIGIPLHEQAKVYELFYRASNVDERRGLGLGLFLVQSISKMMQGHVALVSKGVGQGTTVTVYLPLLPYLE